MKKNKIWHFSDPHTFHYMLKVPEDINIAIFSGDCSNPRDKYKSKEEILNFLEWYGSLDIQYKIFVAGNHDIAIERGLITEEDFTSRGIIYLKEEEVVINGLKIWGSPYTPTFGEGWVFNKSRDTISKVWEQIPDNIDIIVTHGPPKGVLDLSYNRDNLLEFCGDMALKKRIFKIQPKLVCFGHIHNTDNIINSGYTKLANLDTIFSNGAIVEDGKFGRLCSNGNIFEL